MGIELSANDTWHQSTDQKEARTSEASFAGAWRFPSSLTSTPGNAGGSANIRCGRQGGAAAAKTPPQTNFVTLWAEQEHDRVLANHLGSSNNISTSTFPTAQSSERHQQLRRAREHFISESLFAHCLPPVPGRDLPTRRPSCRGPVCRPRDALWALLASQV